MDGRETRVLSFTHLGAAAHTESHVRVNSIRPPSGISQTLLAESTVTETRWVVVVSEAAALLPPSPPSHVGMNIVLLSVLFLWTGNRLQDSSLCLTAEHLPCNKLRPLLLSKKMTLLSSHETIMSIRPSRDTPAAHRENTTASHTSPRQRRT